MKRIVFFFLICCTCTLAPAQNKASIPEVFGNKLQRAKAALMSLYVDSLDENRLVDNAIRGMIEELDPHTQYSTAAEARQLQEMFQGSFDGIGIQYRMLDDTLLVIKTVAGGPSEQAGLKDGDRILKVDDVPIAGVKATQEDLYKRLRGKRGTRVKLSVMRKGQKNTLEFQVKRAPIPTQSIHSAYILSPGVGYIRLETFSQTSYDEFMSAVSRLQKEGMQTLILDLQNNTGGILDAAVKICNEFLEENDMIVYSQGEQYARRNHIANGKGTLKTLPLYVLINEQSASASEVVAGALQDQDRAVIVGRRSFGKGCIQNPIIFRDGSMLRVTIANFYSPSGRCIQKPYEKGKRSEYAKELVQREKTGEIFSADSIHVNDSLRFETLKQHRTVFGGGGIVPDEFVALDTMLISRFFTQVVSKGIVADITTRYWADHRVALQKKYPSFRDYSDRFQTDSELIEKVFLRAKEEKIVPADETDEQNARARLQKYMKVLLATDLFNTDEGIRVGNSDNQILQYTLNTLLRKQ